MGKTRRRQREGRTRKALVQKGEVPDLLPLLLLFLHHLLLHQLLAFLPFLFLSKEKRRTRKKMRKWLTAGSDQLAAS